MTDVPEHVPTPLEVAAGVAPLDVAEPRPAIDVVPDVEPLTPAEVVAAAVLAVPGVVRLHGGRFGELGTYLPGRRVVGVRIDDDGTEVHVVVSDLTPVPQTAARVQRAVSAVAPMPVRVHVEDIDTTV
ncbi:hypothetical protein [Cellulomonas terrae]|uniref:Asp23/Gls24 family envelope stress response protein n=1 Tax=Cellulomonas terrae TaxID=311234 RepID=A0A511JPJ7_9CELL|nr:hypothetical protein [Cellulomonas terrae]GEL99795.1 hypothetical protein CTE05_33420 [Cellulomonas terrae]